MGAAALTANGLRDAAGPVWGQFMWFAVLFCGFLVLAPNITTTAENALRRWVEVSWTALPPLRRWDPHRIRYLFFGTLCAYTVFGLVSLTLWDSVRLLKWAAALYNAAMGFSCWHVLAVNLILLPRELRPNWFLRIGLVLGGLFFMGLSVISAYSIWNEVAK